MPVHAFLKGGHAVLMVQKHEKSPFLADVRQPPPGRKPFARGPRVKLALIRGKPRGGKARRLTYARRQFSIPSAPPNAERRTVNALLYSPELDLVSFLVLLAVLQTAPKVGDLQPFPLAAIRVEAKGLIRDRERSAVSHQLADATGDVYEAAFRPIGCFDDSNG